MSISNHADAWLYADNRAFINGEREFPVNKDEILHNLKIHYGVVEVSLPARILGGVALLLLAIAVGLVGVVVWLPTFLAKEMTFFELLANLFFAFLLALSAYVPLVFAYRFLIPQNYKLKAAWEQLTVTRTVCSGRIVFDKALSVQQSELEYEFLNPQHKRIKGKYRCEKTLPFIFDKQGIRFDDSPTVYPNTKPETVMVWYASDKVHTLL